MAQILLDFPPGPLDGYRQLASFDWKRLKVVLFGNEFVAFEKRMADEVQRSPEFCEGSLITPTLDELRRRGVRRMFTSEAINSFNEVNNPVRIAVALRLWRSIDPGMAVLRSVNYSLIPNALQYMGTERHKDFALRVKRGEITGCFALTEIAHGSNTKGMKTTATYDVRNKQFILNSPNFKAAKCWAGLLGHTATHAIVFAHLTTPDGVKRGLHAFVVPIRDPRTLLPYPGVIAIDMGEKIGLNSIDNGVVMFKNYRIPLENLLNKHADVTEDGTYKTSYTDKSKLHGASFGNLSTGRIDIAMSNFFYLTNALTIAIRYSAVRKQFGTGNGEEEIPLLEYQTHQYRLIPYLAASYCINIACNYLNDYKTPSNDGSGNLNQLSSELHGISSALKPVSGWIARDGIQECREACGGHGYLKAAGLGALKNDQDACLTYEGANHVLLQQTSTWLLKFWPSVLKGQKIVTPLKSLDFLNINSVANAKFSATTIEQIMDHKTILQAYQWLVYYLLQKYHEKYQTLLKNTNAIVAKNTCQVYTANDLATVFVEHFILERMLEKIMESNDHQIKTVLTKLMSLYGLWSLHKHISTLYIGGYVSGPTFGILLQDAILQLCAELKNDAVSLVDVIAPPDFVLNSVLGYSDGQVYKHLEAAMLQTPGALSRPDWWKEIVYWKDYVKPKL